MDGSEPTPGDHGFDHWFSTQNNAMPSHHNPRNFLRNGESCGPMEGYSSSLIVEEAIRFLDTVGDDPFALFVWFHTPHEPVATAAEFMSMYPTGNEDQAIYFGNVTQMDHEKGRLLDALDARELRDNTFVMFTSDNGPETLNRYRNANRSYGSPGPLRGMKLHMYEGGIRVPGIIRWPGHTKAGTESFEPTCGVDMLPTACALAGVSVPPDRALDGASLLPLLEGRPIKRTIPLYWRYDRALSTAKHALREGDWKLLADADFGALELYNLREDLGETTNLVEQQPERARRMLEAIQSIHSSIERDPIST